MRLLKCLMNKTQREPLGVSMSAGGMAENSESVRDVRVLAMMMIEQNGIM